MFRLFQSYIVVFIVGAIASKAQLSVGGEYTSGPTYAPLSLIDYACFHSKAWLLNSDGHYNTIFSSLTDIISSTYEPTIKTWGVEMTGVPNYDRKFTTSDISTLNSRPKKKTDFRNGKNTTAKAGKTYTWGSNIGYNSSSCSLGYWPPGPICPSEQMTLVNFSITPAQEATSGGCYYTAYSPSSYFINGVPLFYWGSNSSYNSEGVWNNVAYVFGQYNLDICYGNANEEGVYHHNSYSPCLMTRLGDNGTNGHSPLHGWAADGFPIYGPYQNTGVVAASCWQKRSYTKKSKTGCSAAGARTCVLVDQYDYTKGTSHLPSTASYGPNTTAAYTTQGGSKITLSSGAYFEDYFFNSSCAAQGGQYLDQHNGHTHDSFGYHYHLTMNSLGVPQFPYAVGPKFYGCLPSGECATEYASGAGTDSGVISTETVSTCKASLGKPMGKSSCLGSYSSGTPVSYPTPTPTTGTVYSISMNITQLVSGRVSALSTLTLTASHKKSFAFAASEALTSEGFQVQTTPYIYRAANTAPAASSGHRRMLLGSSSKQSLYVSYTILTNLPQQYISDSDSISGNLTSALILITSHAQTAMSGSTFASALQLNDSSFSDVIVVSASVSVTVVSSYTYTVVPTLQPTLNPGLTPVGVIIGAVVGGILGMLLLGVVLFCICFRAKASTQPENALLGDGIVAGNR